MKEMKRETVEVPKEKRKCSLKSASIGIILFCVGVMAMSVAKGIELDKKEAELKQTEDEEI